MPVPAICPNDPLAIKMLKRMKGLRNILVHEYGRIDERLVFEILKNNLSDFVSFKQEILQFLRDR
jgi:uncharacterized protein YutE (UPF0331/DUF86 family)